MTAAPAELLEFAWIWNRLSGMGTPAVHRRMLRWLADRGAAGDLRLLLMAFRGCGKSTLVGLYCAWQLYRAPETRILVVAADHALATRMVATVRRILGRHPLCGALLPDHGEGSWASDRFTVARQAVLRDASMLAAGIGGNITGARADLIICDDVEVAGNCGSPLQRAELRERLTETEFVLVPGGRMIFVGTPHCADSLYAERPQAFLAGYRRLVLPLLDAAGRSAWPERFTEASVAALRSRVGPLAFRRQMLLEPVAEEAARLDPALITRYAEDTDYREANGRGLLTLMGRPMVSGGGWWDPAYGRPGIGDASVLAATYADAEGRHYLHRLAYLLHDPEATEDPATQQCRAVAAIAHELLLPVLRVETNGIGRFLPGLLRREMQRLGSPCAVVEATSRRAKAERILAALDPVLAGRRLLAHEGVFRTRFAQEMAEWRPDAPGQHDDALDAVAGCLLAEPVRLPGAPPARRTTLPWRGG
ncbi:phage terminase large subunit [Falsiroseomonas selenitidurans]|uniref:Phage terminase large subunit n=1 Tax=Falsiroseomonas selenitidurans TaxID=2716335 RepID=A0ABX1E0R5_9PROT|nr:phage terminase large subunit [Falsiroseomonas selenitidurans]NKC29423.1 phage terminase large subunit [Falsiroseomonas selenitidurans]